MMNHRTETLDIDVDAQFAQYQDLVEKRLALKNRIEKAEAERQSVSDRVFQRVVKEYSRELQCVEGELEPLARSLQHARSTLQDQMNEIELRVEEIKDQIDEIAFRCRIGEFDESASNEIRAPLVAEGETLARRRQMLSEALSRMEARRGGNEQTRSSDQAYEPVRSIGQQPARARQHAAAPAPVRQHVAEPQSARHDIMEPAPSHPSGGAAQASHRDVPSEAGKNSVDKDSFVDPTEWVGEFVRDEKPAPMESKFEGDPLFSSDVARKNEPVASSSKSEATEDPLAGLADPSEDAADHASTVKTPDNRRDDRGAAYGGLPILTITQGPGAGKTLPLLPMTMTLGREVDNNIELKDVDVARYHARISFEAGQYVLQDLEGSSGTFLNGEKISRAPLAPGSTIRVGGTELHFDMG